MDSSSSASSDAMEISSSSSSHFSYLSYPSSYGGSTPEYDLAAVAEANARRYEALAPEWWDERDWVSSGESEDEPLTDGEDDLRFLVDGALVEESDDDRFSWDGDLSSDEEEEMEDDTSSIEYPPVKRFRAGSWDDDDVDEDEEEEAPAIGFSSSEDSAGSSADASEPGDDEGSDGGEGAGF
jgi:hypothetical protein